MAGVCGDELGNAGLNRPKAMARTGCGLAPPHLQNTKDHLMGGEGGGVGMQLERRDMHGRAFREVSGPSGCMVLDSRIQAKRGFRVWECGS